jgi:hypothetical protein
MEVFIPDYKRDQVVELLATWIARESYTLLEATKLLGLLNNLSEICRWARPRYFALQNEFDGPFELATKPSEVGVSGTPCRLLNGKRSSLPLWPCDWNLSSNAKSRQCFGVPGRLSWPCLSPGRS